MKKELNELQMRILDVIVVYQEEHGEDACPSINYIHERVSDVSRPTIHYNFKEIQRKGWIDVIDPVPRKVEVLL